MLSILAVISFIYSKRVIKNHKTKNGIIKSVKQNQQNCS